MRMLVFHCNVFKYFHRWGTDNAHKRRRLWKIKTAILKCMAWRSCTHGISIPMTILGGGDIISYFFIEGVRIRKYHIKSDQIYPQKSLLMANFVTMVRTLWTDTDTVPFTIKFTLRNWTTGFAVEQTLQTMDHFGVHWLFFASCKLTKKGGFETNWGKLVWFLAAMR